MRALYPHRAAPNHRATATAYDQVVATATPSSTPNPDAMKFTLDTKLEAMFNATSAECAADNPFVADVFAAGGVATVFGVNDFVTVTRQPGADWDPIIAAVNAAAEAHL
jgi:hypothetical protein